MAQWVRSTVRTAKLVCLLIYGAAQLLMKRPATQPKRSEWLREYTGWLLRKLDIRVRSIGKFPTHGVLIANHQGYLDIMALASLGRAVFVSKAEVQSWPLVGWMITMAGTMFVERGKGGSAERVKAGMQAAANEGLAVVFFPEGTTTNGETLLRFHTGLLVQSMEAGQPVMPAFIRYRLTEDNGPDVSVADNVCYWDKTPLPKHIFRLMGLKGIEVTVRFADTPIEFSVGPEEREAAAMEARAAVIELGEVNPVPVS